MKLLSMWEPPALFPQAQQHHASEMFQAIALLHAQLCIEPSLGAKASDSNTDTLLEPSPPTSCRRTFVLQRV